MFVQVSIINSMSTIVVLVDLQMLRRSAVLAGSLAATFPFAASRVEASDKTETKEPSSTVKASQVGTSTTIEQVSAVATLNTVYSGFCHLQLSLYDNPPATQYEFIEEEIGQFRQIVSKVRKASWNFMDSIKVSYVESQLCTYCIPVQVFSNLTHTETFVMCSAFIPYPDLYPCIDLMLYMNCKYPYVLKQSFSVCLRTDCLCLHFLH